MNMNKIKYLFVIVCVITAIISCSDDKKYEPFDPEKQALKDNDSLVKFLKNHFYDTQSKEVKVLELGKTALFNDTKLKHKKVDANGLKYTLYIYKTVEGTQVQPKEKDSVLVNYRGLRIVNSQLGDVFDEHNLSWFKLSEVVKGWTYGISEFKSGLNVTETNQPIRYEDYGQGLLFIPSGLGYGNTTTLGYRNQNMMFYIGLLDVNKTK